MKNILIAMLALASGVTVFATVQQNKASDCGSCPADTKVVQANQAKDADCCATGAKATQVKEAKAMDCCAAGGKATQAKQAKSADCCSEAGKAAQAKMAMDCKDCPADKMAECAANQGDCKDCDMNGKTKQVKVVKGTKATECSTGYAKYKVYVDGKYYYYGCEESAGAARTKWVAKAFHVGTVQKVVGKVRIPANQAS